MNKNGKSESAPAIDRAFLKIIEAHKQRRVITDISTALKQVTMKITPASIIPMLGNA